MMIALSISLAALNAIVAVAHYDEYKRSPNKLTLACAVLWSVSCIINLATTAVLIYV